MPGTQASVEGDGAHFEAVIVNADFEGKSLIQRHQMVYRALGDRMKAEIHALSMKTVTPDEQQALGSEYSPIPIDEAGTRFRIMWERVLQHRGPGMTLQMAATSFAENLRAGDDYEWGHRAAFDYAGTYNRRLGQIDHPVLVLNPADDCQDCKKY